MTATVVAAGAGIVSDSAVAGSQRWLKIGPGFQGHQDHPIKGQEQWRKVWHLKGQAGFHRAGETWDSPLPKEIKQLLQTSNTTLNIN